MARRRWRNGALAFGAITAGLLMAAAARAQEPARPSAQGGACMANVTIDQILRMDAPGLDRLYLQGTAAPVPCGKVRGQPIAKPGSAFNVAASKAGRMVWQGKVFAPTGDAAVNRFFGIKMIPGKVYYGESWMDGRQSLILDYRGTSLLYHNNRDEIREVAPGLYLGLMYAQECPQPKLKLYFLLEVCPPTCP